MITLAKRMLAGCAFLAFLLNSIPVPACTIFVLTDTNQALFCNNEDSSKPNTRIWFVPAGEGHLGAVYVGYDDGLAQGGLNSEGLAFDWVSGFNEQWNPDPHLPSTHGSSSTRMLETCKTVADAIAFYQNHKESSFSFAKILVADRSGASVIIGAKDGKLQIEEDNQCRGFGAGWLTLDISLSVNSQPTITNGFNILRDCRQKSRVETKYSNIYDLKTGDIFLYPFPLRDDEIKLNLTGELKKGFHYYDMAQIQQQLHERPRPLLLNMKRFLLDEFKPIPDHDPALTAHVRAMLKDSADGTLHADDYSTNLWQELSADRKKIQTQLKDFGNLTSLTLVDKSGQGDRRNYRYRLEFENATFLQHLVFDSKNKLISSSSEDFVLRPGTNSSPAAGPDKLAGIGVGLGLVQSNLVVTGVFRDSPALAANLHRGDRIIAVAQEYEQPVPLRSKTIVDAASLIRGPKGTPVYLTIVPAKEPDSNARVVRLIRGELKSLVHPAFLPDGMNAPDIEMTELNNGKLRHLSDFAGKTVVLQFWKASSQSCQSAMENFKIRADAHPEWKDNVIFIAASLDETNTAPSEYLKAHGPTLIHHFWIKADAINTWEIPGVPATYVIDPRQKILASGFVAAMEPVFR